MPQDGELHAHARLAAGASEAASLQGKFWSMHDVLFASPKALEEADLVGYAVTLIITTPTFFINGARFNGTPDLESLSAAILAAS